MSKGTAPEGPTSGLVPLSNEDVVEMPFAVGDVIAGKYEVVGLIGSGGMGYVVAALHIELGEMVALKFLRSEALAQEELVERFAREARAAVRIKSEYVARVMDVGTLPDGVPFIVMEHLEGKDLADVLAEQGRLPARVAVEYMMQACEALASAHANGIVHRDIKPENLFLTRHAQGVDIIKVLDFGISKLALTSPASKGSRQFVRTMMPMGSPTYMSPEQIRSSGEVDARTDIWSLGCVLFELLTGTTAFDAPTLMQLSAAILEKEPTPLSTLLPDASPELEAVVARCLQKDVTQRFQNIAELAVALYPFAPRRARISAERCSYLLRDAGLPAAEIEIGSVAPPDHQHHSGERRAQTVTSGIGRANTGPTAAVAPIESVSAAALRPSKRGLFIGMGLALVAAGVAFWQFRGEAESEAAKPIDDVRPAIAAATPEAAPAAAVNGASPARAKAGRATESPNDQGATDETADNQPPSSARATTRIRPRPVAPVVARPPAGAAVRAPKPRPVTGPARSKTDEPDVGY